MMWFINLDYGEDDDDDEEYNEEFRKILERKFDNDEKDENKEKEEVKVNKRLNKFFQILIFFSFKV